MVVREIKALFVTIVDSMMGKICFAAEKDGITTQIAMAQSSKMALDHISVFT